MRIAIVSRGYSLHGGGAERVTVNLYRSLLEAGHDVHIFSGKAADEPLKGLKLQEVSYIKAASPLRILSFH